MGRYSKPYGERAIHQADLQRIESEIAKNNAERIKLSLESEVVRRRLSQNWFKSQNFLRPFVGSIVAGGLMTAWLIAYLGPIRSRSEEIRKYDLILLAQKTEIQRQTNELQRLELLRANSDLRDAQVAEQRQAETRLGMMKGAYNSLSDQCDSITIQRDHLVGLTQGLKCENATLKDDVESLRNAVAETDSRLQRIREGLTSTQPSVEHTVIKYQRSNINDYQEDRGCHRHLNGYVECPPM